MAHLRALPGLVLAAAVLHSQPAAAKADTAMLAVAPASSVLGAAPAGGSPTAALPASRPLPLPAALPPTAARATAAGPTAPAPPGDAPPTAVAAPCTSLRDLDRELRRLYRQYQPALQSCFLRLARRGLEPETKLELTLAVDDAGAVRRVAFDAPATPALAECLQRWVGRFRFSPGERAELALALLFRGRPR